MCLLASLNFDFYILYFSIWHYRCGMWKWWWFNLHWLTTYIYHGVRHGDRNTNTYCTSNLWRFTFATSKSVYFTAYTCFVLDAVVRVLTWIRHCRVLFPNPKAELWGGCLTLFLDFTARENRSRKFERDEKFRDLFNTHFDTIL